MGLIAICGALLPVTGCAPSPPPEVVVRHAPQVLPSLAAIDEEEQGFAEGFAAGRIMQRRLDDREAANWAALAQDARRDQAQLPAAPPAPASIYQAAGKAVPVAGLKDPGDCVMLVGAACDW